MLKVLSFVIILCFIFINIFIKYKEENNKIFKINEKNDIDNKKNLNKINIDLKQKMVYNNNESNFFIKKEVEKKEVKEVVLSKKIKKSVKSLSYEHLLSQDELEVIEEEMRIEDNIIVKGSINEEDFPFKDREDSMERSDLSSKNLLTTEELDEIEQYMDIPLPKNQGSFEVE